MKCFRIYFLAMAKTELSALKAWASGNRLMIHGVILICDNVNDPVHCNDLFSFESPKDPSTLASLKAIVQTQEGTLSFLENMFPIMKRLRLNNSIIPSVRDTGCTLVSLRFFSLARCTVSIDALLPPCGLHNHIAWRLRQYQPEGFQGSISSLP
jgi:hypothetical protein